MQADIPQPDTPVRWRVMVDPIASLEPSTIQVQIVPSGTSLADAVARMQERNVGYVLVTGADGRLIGMLTEHDLTCKVIGDVPDLAARTVDEFMIREPTTLTADEPIKHALHYMAVQKSMYIPLVDAEGRPTDLISFRRLARLLEQIG